MSELIADAPERLMGIDPRGSFIVQAPAGSGKTELLTQRFLALLSRVERPDEILAITFTRKAAGEMRHRLLESLEKASGPEPHQPHARQTWELARAALQRDASRGWSLLENPALLKIQTIDSFNSSLVRSMPILSRFGGVSRIAEDPEILYRQASEKMLGRLGSDRSGSVEIALLLAHLDNRLERLRDLFVAMLARRDQWLRHVVWQNPEKEREQLESALTSVVEKSLQALQNLIPEHLREQLLSLGRYAAANLPESSGSAITGLRDCTCFPQARAADLPLWKSLADLLLASAGTFRKRLDVNCGFPPGKNNQAADMKASMTAILDALRSNEVLESGLHGLRNLPDPVYTPEQWRVLRAVVVLLPLAVSELWAEFQAAGEVDFAEVALKAIEGLGRAESPTDLLLGLDSRINHILVDEFQDTSFLQYQLLQLLVSGWAPGDGRTLFLVGDPMQSIYRFREAEVGLFLRARSEGMLGGVLLQPLRLSCNFRSQAGIVDWVNAVFAQVFPPGEDGFRGAVAFAQATSVRPALEGEAVRLLPWPRQDDEAEAEAVAAAAARALAEDDRGTVAVLVRARSHLPRILEALKARGLRYQAQDIDPLQDRPLARDLISLVRALLHWGDRLCWLSVLRAPWCGLSLTDLLALCGGSDLPIPDLLQDAQALERLSPEGRRRAEKTAEVLLRGAEHRGRIGLRQLVEGTWLALGGWSHLEESDLEDARRVFELLQKQDRGGELESLEAFEKAVSGLYAAPDTSNDGRLQVMTIHKSKGLEFDTVILPGLGKKGKGADNQLLRWMENPDGCLLLAPIPEPARDDRGERIYDLIGAMEKEKDELETVRLLYVAATRARRRLYLSGHLGSARHGGGRPAAGSFLHRLWPALEQDFTRNLHSSEDNWGEETAREEPPPLQRYPLDWVPPALERSMQREDARALSPSASSHLLPQEGLFTGWESEIARHVGTVTHQLLEELGQRAGELLEGCPEPMAQTVVPARLKALGVPTTGLAEASLRVKEAVNGTLGSRRGRWILDKHREAASEVALCGVVEGALVHAVIDRTFVDGKGQRWIIDFKTSTPGKGRNVDDFLQSEAQRYQGQLKSYQALYRALEPHRSIRCALYFPLFDGWHEYPES